MPIHMEHIVSDVPLTVLLASGDSRTPHYNLAPTGTQDRMAVYTCYMPVSDASQEDLLRKKAAYEGKTRNATSFPLLSSQ